LEKTSATIARVTTGPAKNKSEYDVVIIGGALSGAATAFLLLQENPSLKVLIIEKSTAFTRRVGEATVEISGYFLMRVLGLTNYLNHHHLNKNGLRFWFFNERAQQLDECSEIGGKFLSRVPSYLVDRSTMDEEVLRRAVASGAELWRPATVESFELKSGGLQKIKVKFEERVEEISARWIIDASGVAALLARRNGWLKPNLEHPTTSVWSRWKNVKDFDDLALAKKFPAWAMKCVGVRGTATNHLFGDGWWAWWIPLKGGDVSIGVTFDQRLVNFPENGSPAERLKNFLMQHPVARELMSDATWMDGDVHWRKNLAYFSTTFAGDGFILVGDAAGFIDPFYSPGMDWIAYTTCRAKDLILAERAGSKIESAVEKHNADFSRSYHRWFEALYKDRYEYFGDYELIRLSFLLDLGFYYFGVVVQPYRRGLVALSEPSFSTPPAKPFYKFMSFYNRRFAEMARIRRARGTLGVKNNSQRFLFGGYVFSPLSARHIVKALFAWLALELKEGWRSWFSSRKKMKTELPTSVATAPPPISKSSAELAHH
jgi:flavin-dependent dehydrogenase